MEFALSVVPEVLGHGTKGLHHIGVEVRAVALQDHAHRVFMRERGLVDPLAVLRLAHIIKRHAARRQRVGLAQPAFRVVPHVPLFPVAQAGCL